MTARDLWDNYLKDINQGSKLKDAMESSSISFVPETADMARAGIPVLFIICLTMIIVYCVITETSKLNPIAWTDIAKDLEVEDIIKFLQTKDILKQCIEKFKEWEIDGVQLLSMIEDIKDETWDHMKIKTSLRLKIKGHFKIYCSEKL